MEFAYLDYLFSRHLRARAGLVLIPDGIVNETHEPPTFLGAIRPDVEQVPDPHDLARARRRPLRRRGRVLLPDVHGQRLELEGIHRGGDRRGAPGGLGGARRELGGDGAVRLVAVSGRAPRRVGLFGKLGPGSSTPSGRSFSGTTTLFDVHADWKWRGLWLRGLYVHTTISDAAAINEVNGLVGEESVGSRQWGWYLQGGVRRAVVEGGRARVAHPVPALRALQHAGGASRRATQRNPENDVNAPDASASSSSRSSSIVFEARLAAAQERAPRPEWTSGTSGSATFSEAGFPDAGGGAALRAPSLREGLPVAGGGVEARVSRRGRRAGKASS